MARLHFTIAPTIRAIPQGKICKCSIPWVKHPNNGWNYLGVQTNKPHEPHMAYTSSKKPIITGCPEPCGCLSPWTHPESRTIGIV